uniref:CD302 molecule n=1 Tax=Naja naja TaxID=35670 RepID=A0A8C6Y5C4_NAJNA
MDAPSSASYSACFLSGFLLAAALPSLGTDACPSIAWIPFQKSCYALLQGSSEVYGMDDARELCRGNASGADIITINSKDENTFIQNNFHSNWHGPEYISLGMFFDTDVLYEKTRLFETAWTSIIVVISTITVAISAAFLWFLYQRRISSRPRCSIHNSSTQIPCDNETFFIDEVEYSA